MSESEESDGEGGLGNLNRLIVRPPGHSGKAKKGHLCFDAAFETGNLGRADHVTELEYDLFIRPDTCRPRSRFWFNFTVENVRQDQRVIFNIVNFGKYRNLYMGDMTPLVKSTSRTKWQRIPRRYIFYHRSALHKGRHVLSIAFAFDREEDIYQFAAAPPYSYTRLQKHLTYWLKKAGSLATRELLTESTNKRRVDILTIGERREEHFDSYLRKTESNKKHVILIIVRSHGGESPSSFVCQGFLDYLISSAEKARALRNGIIIKVVPMLNPDGVFVGNMRSDILGSDLNRSWHDPTEYSHPALVAVKKLVKDLQADKEQQLDFVLDIHADVSHEGVFIHGNSYDDVYRYERHVVLPKLLSKHIEGWRQEYCQYNNVADKEGTCRRTFSVPVFNVKSLKQDRCDDITDTFSHGAMNMDGSSNKKQKQGKPCMVDSYSLIVSMGGRRLKPGGQYMHYNEIAYMRIGRALCNSFCEFYRQRGICAPPLIRTKKRRHRPATRRKRSYASRTTTIKPISEKSALSIRLASPPIVNDPPITPRIPRPFLRGSRNMWKLERFSSIYPLIIGSPLHPTRLNVLDFNSKVRYTTVNKTHLLHSDMMHWNMMNSTQIIEKYDDSSSPEPYSDTDSDQNN